MGITKRSFDLARKNEINQCLMIQGKRQFLFAFGLLSLYNFSTANESPNKGSLSFNRSASPLALLLRNNMEICFSVESTERSLVG
mmetsp:Transcript_118302/g.232261  ORF Transcript_118302/g.232261 Transcript_118302/m.232261 type:complete len:85 (+) Transcript_118302:6616-6870(+)